FPTRQGDDATNYHELHAVETNTGKLIAHIRNHNPANDRETLQSESTDGGITWVNIVDTTTSLVYSNLDSTTSYSAIVQSGVCSTDTSSITVITVNPTPVAGFSVADVCIGQTSVFVNSSTVSTGLLQFIIWNFGDSTSSVATNPIHLYALAGTYPTTLKVISDMGCVNTITNNAIVNPLPNPTITPSGPTSFCFGGNVTLSGENGLTYSWSTSDTTQSIVVSTSGTYHLTVTNPTTSCVNSDSIVVEVFPLPVAYPGNDTIISLGFSYTLNAQQGVIFSWLPATGLSNSNIYNPIAEPLVTTTYLLTVTDDNGCSNSSSLLIKVLNDYLFTASNALTPNGDGLNDVWNIQNIENYPDNSLAVFNRYGQEVYTASPYKNDWGGTYNGELLPDGTYYYVLKFTGSEKIFKGGVTIISGGN
ncbi:MAG: gliding motility-associated C-terminal domain-containing protein, partial [Bacteroidota bacterium]